MEEDEAAATPQDPGMMMRSLALTATGEFLLLLGVVFALLGISDFLTGLIGIKGAGGFLVGIALVLVAMVLLLRSRAGMARPKLPMKRKEQRSEDYR